MGCCLRCCVTTIFLQVLSNLANDYGDTVNGADHAGRTGPGGPFGPVPSRRCHAHCHDCLCSSLADFRIVAALYGIWMEPSNDRVLSGAWPVEYYGSHSLYGG